MLFVEYGGNPLATVPDQFADAPFIQYITWHGHVDTYGPIWEYANGAVSMLVRAWLQATGGWGSGQPSCPASLASCQMLAAYVHGYQMLAIVLAGACGWLIYAIAQRSRPQYAYAALLVWLWNPLLLTSSALGAHNDLVMLTLLLAGFWLFQRQRWLAGLLMVALAAHVKLTALLLAPVFGLWLVRQIGWRRAVGYGCVTVVIALALSWLLYAPLGGWETLPRMLHERSLYVANSPHHVVYRLLLERGWTGAALRPVTIVWPSIVFAVLALGICLATIGFRRRPRSDVKIASGEGRGATADITISAVIGAAGMMPDDAILWGAAVAVTLTYLLVGSFWFQPWYMLWVLAPAALLPDSRFTRAVLPWLCLGALWSNILFDYLPQLAGEPLNRTQRVAAVVAATWLPALAALLTEAVLHAKRHAVGDR